MKIWEVMHQDNVGKEYEVELDGFHIIFEVKLGGNDRVIFLDTEILESDLDGDAVYYHKYTSLEDTFILDDILKADFTEV